MSMDTDSLVRGRHSLGNTVMNRRIRTLFAVTAFVSMVSGSDALAAGIQKGAAMHVKPNSMWFKDAAALTRWQALQKAGDTAALISMQTDLLWNHTASQFTEELPVKVLQVEAKSHQIKVEMTFEGSMHGSTWVLDESALRR
jgi:hypothetical protein